MATGVRLRTLTERAPPGRHMHLALEGWTITSNHAVHELHDVDVLATPLPGYLGSYFYPEDAVFALDDVKHTKLSHWHDTIAREEERVRLRERRFVDVNRVVFEEEDEAAAEEEEDAEEEEFIDDDDAEHDGDDADACAWLEDAASSDDDEAPPDAVPS